MNNHWPVSEMRLIRSSILGWVKLHVIKGQYMKPQERSIEETKMEKLVKVDFKDVSIIVEDIRVILQAQKDMLERGVMPGVYFVQME